MGAGGNSNPGGGWNAYIARNTFTFTNEEKIIVTDKFIFVSASPTPTKLISSMQLLYNPTYGIYVQRDKTTGEHYQPYSNISVNPYALLFEAIREENSRNQITARSDGIRFGGLLPVAITGSLDIDVIAGSGADINPIGTGYVFRGKDKGETFKFNDASMLSAGFNIGVGAEVYIWFYTGDIANFGIHSFNGNRHEFEANYSIFGTGLIFSEPDTEGGILIGVKFEISTPGLSGGYNYGKTTVY